MHKQTDIHLYINIYKFNQIMAKKIQSILQTMMLIGKSIIKMAYQIIWEWKKYADCFEITLCVAVTAGDFSVGHRVEKNAKNYWHNPADYDSNKLFVCERWMPGWRRTLVILGHRFVNCWWILVYYQIISFL